jgi:hypothetical protein
LPKVRKPLKLRACVFGDAAAVSERSAIIANAAPRCEVSRCGRRAGVVWVIAFDIASTPLDQPPEKRTAIWLSPNVMKVRSIGECIDVTMVCSPCIVSAQRGV